ncbi:MAG TPA: flagellar export chaperone FliS [Verrucomicrobiae bacterium]|jgi:flagellar protein FliS|nr:flagellar export chaperone FliS [Verrucomicrobiae bacterium]
MQRNNPWQSYRKVATQTASPGQLVLMLYEGAIRFSEQALAGFEHRGDPLAFNLTINNNIHRAQAIIMELNAVLNMRGGGEVAANFRRLYLYMDRRLREANIRKQKEPIEEVIMRLRVIRDSWAEMLQQRPQGVNQNQGELQTA